MGPAPRPEATPDDPKSWPVKRARSFGGVVVRSTGDGLEVAMIRTRNLKGESVWTLPKGTPDEGETPEETAVREVREETGLDVRILQPLEPNTYWFVSAKERARYHKTVRLYLMEATGGDISGHDDEIDEVRWMPVDEAAGAASYPSDRKLLRTVAQVAAS
jgi:ADP-ribose pyrophosphatase YjhB (NUDIX family)